MKVFYVVVLVLVAWAVPSHGRTETEGTVFNKTQLHGSMSNVTVRSSKLENFRFSYLAMQWPTSYCITEHCNQLVPDRFTVHGLWPQYNLAKSVDCGRIHQSYPRFNIRQLNGGLVQDLNFHWPDLKRRIGYNQFFWGNEYNKHGSCTFNDSAWYFSHALALARNFEHLIQWLTGTRGGIEFGRLYHADFIRNAVHRVTTKWPRLRCDNRRNLLLEIRFCVENGLLINCDLYTDCGNRKVYLPWPMPLRP